jgi:hypothetical protein
MVARFFPKIVSKPEGAPSVGILYERNAPDNLRNDTGHGTLVKGARVWYNHVGLLAGYEEHTFFLLCLQAFLVVKSRSARITVRLVGISSDPLFCTLPCSHSSGRAFAFCIKKAQSTVRQTITSTKAIADIPCFLFRAGPL